MTKWYEKAGPEGDIVISTRIRFARNLAKFPFPCKMARDQRLEVIELVKKAVLTDELEGKSEKSSGCKKSNEFDANKNTKEQKLQQSTQKQFNVSGENYKNLALLNFSKLNELERLSLLEKHVISPDFFSNKKEKGLFVSEDDSISIMVNEEDHLRLQVMAQGLDFDSAFAIADKLDTELDKKLSFAFDDKLGYLTQCPTNLGTGMRASVMLHLPGLRETGVMNKISSNLLKLGLTIRGIYGEGTNPKGDIYQLSNQVSLGLSEKAAIKNLKDITMQLIAKERNLRKEFSKHIDIIDKIHRSYGVLKSARIISSDEFMKLISNVRLGVSLNELTGISYDKINALIIKIQPATLSLSSAQTKEITPLKRDELRAELIRSAV